MCDKRESEFYERAFRETLKDFSVSESGKISGICDSLEEIEHLFDKLRTVGFTYSVRRSRYSKPCTDSTKSNKNFFFQQLDGNVHVNFFGAAFSVESVCQRQCALGPRYYKKKEIAVADHLADHVNPRKKRLLLMDTKKSDCPATLEIKSIRVYPGYSVQNVNEHWKTKADVIKRLRNDLLLPNKPSSYLRYYVVASSANHHTHSCESVKANGCIHPLLANEIRSLVQDGIVSLSVIKLTLDRFVKNNFNTHTPDQLNTTFYPPDKIIYNHVYRALYNIKKPVYDQDTLQSVVEVWLKESNGTNIYFRPYKDCDGKVEPLLFCYQNSWQSDLLMKYGDRCLLDATYKTTKYEIPLFFITIKSNVCYLVVGFFFIQVENTASINEALQIFKGWNKDWNPTYWVTDYSESEINAIKHTFPQTKVYLCSFHRKQAWQRWLSKRDNLTVPGDSELILKLWEKIAESPTEELFNVNTNEWKTHETFQRNKGAANYFKNLWLKKYRMWVKACGDKGKFGTINTTNGVETMNKIVKHFFLKDNIDKSLSGVTKILVNRFLPSLIKKYSQKNSSVRSYRNDIPLFLHKKTQTFIRHVTTRYVSAPYEISRSSVIMKGEGLFEVESSVSSVCRYIVNFSEPNCTCADFQRYRFPCKHFCAVFIYYPEWGFDKIEDSYRNSPLICLDEVYGVGLSRNCAAHSVSQETNSDEETDVAVSLQETGAIEAGDEHPVEETPEALSFDSELREARELCKYITNLTYNATDRESVKEAIEFLKNCARTLERANPDAEGLPLVVPSTSKQ